MIHRGVARAAGILAGCALLLSPTACEKKTHRASQLEYRNLMAASMAEDDRAGALEEFVRRFPEPKTNPNLARACQHLAQYHARAGRPDTAASWYESALRAKPDDPDLLNRLGYHYANEGMNLDRAVEVLELAVRLSEERGYPERRQGFFKDSLGWAHRMRGDLPRAVVLLEEACRLAPGVPILREHLAEAYRAIGERERALELYLELFLEKRGTEPRSRSGLTALGEEGGPELARRIARRIEQGLADLQEADMRDTASEGAVLIRLTGNDGQPIVGSLFKPPRPGGGAAGPSPARAGGVLLLHGLGSDRGAATQTARLLAENGLFALTLDLRGHGASVSEALATPHQFTEDLEANLAAARQDAGVALDYLRRQPGVDGSRIGAVGEGLGGLVATRALDGTSSRETALVILSPWGQAEAYRPHLESLGAEAIFVLAASEDRAASSALQKLTGDRDPISMESVLVPGAARGFQLLREDPDLRGRFASFLSRRLQ
jgi:dienelactone hydrolase/Tfp pilus assembly protein PilF